MKEQEEPGEQDAPETTREPLRWVGVVVVFVFAATGFWWFTAAPPPNPGEAPSLAEPPSVSAPPPQAPLQGTPSLPPALPEDPLAAFREQTRYPPGVGKLEDYALDLVDPNRRYDRPRPVEETVDRGPDGVVTFVLEADHYFYTGDEVVGAELRVRKGRAKHPVQIVRAWAEAESATGTVAQLPLSFRDQAGVPTAALDLGQHFPEHLGTIQLWVRFEVEPGLVEEASMRIYTTPAEEIPAEFTGRDRDEIRDGSLMVEAGIEVRERGFYRIDANLYATDGRPLAYTTFKGELDVGTRSVPLEFFGKLLLDLAEPGPYELRQLRGYLFREAQHPDRKRMRDATHVHRTRAYTLASFSDAEYMSPHKQRMLELLEQDMQAGLAIETPTVPDVQEP